MGQKESMDRARQAVLKNAPTFDHEQVAQAIVRAFERGRTGINFRNARPYVIGWYRGKKMYFCSERGWNKGIEDFAGVLREIFEPEGYENVSLAGHDQYFSLAWRVDQLLSASETGKFLHW